MIALPQSSESPSGTPTLTHTSLRPPKIDDIIVATEEASPARGTGDGVHTALLPSESMLASPQWARTGSQALQPERQLREERHSLEPAGSNADLKSSAKQGQSNVEDDLETSSGPRRTLRRPPPGVRREHEHLGRTTKLKNMALQFSQTQHLAYFPTDIRERPTHAHLVYARTGAIKPQAGGSLQRAQAQIARLSGTQMMVRSATRYPVDHRAGRSQATCPVPSKQLLQDAQSSDDALTKGNNEASSSEFPFCHMKTRIKLANAGSRDVASASNRDRSNSFSQDMEEHEQRIHPAIVRGQFSATEPENQSLIIRKVQLSESLQKKSSQRAQVPPRIPATTVVQASSNRATVAADEGSDLAQVILIKETQSLHSREQVAVASALYPSTLEQIDPYWRAQALGSSSTMKLQAQPARSPRPVHFSQQREATSLNARKVLMSHAH